MNQVLHIFAKDTRRLRLELLISLAMTTAFVTGYPHRWLGDGSALNGTVSYSGRAFLTDPGIALQFLVLLIVLSWWVIISPAVHQENLVGDRQYWLTRPISSAKLLLAKFLLIAVFIVIPLLVAQCIMIALAGFSPFGYLPGLLYNLVFVVIALMLPIMAFSTVTRSFFRMVLAGLGYVSCLFLLSRAVSLAHKHSVSGPTGDFIVGWLLVCGFVAAIFFQYLSRRSAVAWSALAASMLLMFVTGWIDTGRGQIEKLYPIASSPDIVFSASPTPEFAPSAFRGENESWVHLVMPLRISGIPSGTVIVPYAVRPTLTAANGTQWASEWQALRVDLLLPGEHTVRVPFDLPRTIYDMYRVGPLHLHLDLALSRARQGQTTHAAMQLSDFEIPGVGICRAIPGFANKPDQFTQIGCRAPLRQPQLTLVQSSYTVADCGDDSVSFGPSGPRPEQPTAQLAMGWLGGIERPPAEFGVGSVWVGAPNFDFPYLRAASNEWPHFCPGTPATFTTFDAAGRFRTSFDEKGLTMPAIGFYVPPNNSSH